MLFVHLSVLLKWASRNPSMPSTVLDTSAAEIETTREWARWADANDPLAPLRDRFELPRSADGAPVPSNQRASRMIMSKVSEAIAPGNSPIRQLSMTGHPWRS
jgi:hypothetical protein